MLAGGRSSMSLREIRRRIPQEQSRSGTRRSAPSRREKGFVPRFGNWIYSRWLAAMFVCPKFRPWPADDPTWMSVTAITARSRTPCAWDWRGSMRTFLLRRVVIGRGVAVPCLDGLRTMHTCSLPRRSPRPSSGGQNVCIVIDASADVWNGGFERRAFPSFASSECSLVVGRQWPGYGSGFPVGLEETFPRDTMPTPECRCVHSGRPAHR